MFICKLRFAALTLSLFFLPAQAQEPMSRSVKLNGGMVGYVVKVGHSSNRGSISATVRIENKGSATAFLAQVGPATISDNIGFSAQSHQASGIGFCNSDVNSVSMVCLGGNGFPMSMQAFTQIDPGTTATINLAFNSPRQIGPTMAITMSVLARFVTNVDHDIEVPDRTKYQQFRLMNVGFPSIPVQEQ